jgi:aminoglycoside phosphotransferase (APT) family kinase protein
MTTPGYTAAVPAGLDLDRLAGYLAAHRPGLLDGHLAASLIPGGRSNLTYVVRSGSLEYVLRRPPLGHVLATAHDMVREFRVISALATTGVPVPGTLLLCTDPVVIGAPFYLMTRAPGVVFRARAQTDPLTDAQRRDLAYAMMDGLATLHSVDAAAVGLADFGRPEGYLGRQVRRWAGQLERSRSRPLPGIEELRDRLAASVPASDAAPVGAARIVHGDYRLDNLLFATTAGGPPCTAVDWQLVAIGLPARDLGYFLGTGLKVDERVDHERDLVRAYHDALAGRGVEGYPFEQCWDDYRYGLFQGPLITVLGAMYATRTDRGDEMFVAMTERSTAAIRETGALELL